MNVYAFDSRVPKQGEQVPNDLKGHFHLHLMGMCCIFVILRRAKLLFGAAEAIDLCGRWLEPVQLIFDDRDDARAFRNELKICKDEFDIEWIPDFDPCEFVRGKFAVTIKQSSLDQMIKIVSKITHRLNCECSPINTFTNADE